MLQEEGGQLLQLLLFLLFAVAALFRSLSFNLALSAQEAVPTLTQRPLILMKTEIARMLAAVSIPIPALQLTAAAAAAAFVTRARVC